jgi:RimJ/RimL family protein N-acetyltransferase
VADDVLALDHLRLEVKGDNLRAIRAYEAAGFIRDDTRVGAGDSLVMERNRR